MRALSAVVHEARADMVIRTSLPSDLPYIRHLGKQESFALGWIPEQIYERVWGVRFPPFTGWLLLCEVNLDPVGFCFAAPAHRPPFYGRIYQLAVQKDARRFQYGSFLADISHRLIMKAGGNGTTLRCAADLPANKFWQALGWDEEQRIPVGSRVGDSPRTTKRELIQRVKRIGGFLLNADSHQKVV